MNEPKKPLLTKPAGCFVQLVGACVILWGMSRLAVSPPDIWGAIFPLALGGAILLLGRKTR